MDKPQEITGTRYVLAVRNLIRSADYYQSKLGFNSSWTGDGWHFLSRGKFVVMLGECPDEMEAKDTNNHSYFAYIDMVGIDSIYKEFKSNEVDIINELADKPWGQREFGIRTIDGHRIMFGEALIN